MKFKNDISFPENEGMRRAYLLCKKVPVNLCKLWLEEIQHKNVSVSEIKEWHIGACKCIIAMYFIKRYNDMPINLN